MLELTLRLIFSLAVVVGLLLLLARIAGRRFRGGNGSLVTILHRQSLSRGSAVVVVSVGTRVLVLGTTEQQVRVLTELEPDEVEAAAPVEEISAALPTPARGAHRAEAAPALTAVRTADGPLSGSVLSVDTWRQALAAATRRAS